MLSYFLKKSSEYKIEIFPNLISNSILSISLSSFGIFEYLKVILLVLVSLSVYITKSISKIGAKK